MGGSVEAPRASTAAVLCGVVATLGLSVGGGLALVTLLASSGRGDGGDLAHGTPFKVGSHLIEGVSLIVGGYLSALIAGKNQLRNGVCVGIVMLLPVGALYGLWLMNELNQGLRDMPGLVERALVLAALIPLAGLGGWFRQNQVD